MPLDQAANNTYRIIGCLLLCELYLFYFVAWTLVLFYSFVYVFICFHDLLILCEKWIVSCFANASYVFVTTMQHLCCRSAAFLFCCHVAIFYCCVSDARLLIAFLHVCCNLSWCCSDVFLMCCCSSVAVMLLFCLCFSDASLLRFGVSSTVEAKASSMILFDNFSWVWKSFFFCSASSWQAICNSIRSQFARVVKGVDLRSTAGNCAWVRTPQLTHFSDASFP